MDRLVPHRSKRVEVVETLQGIRAELCKNNEVMRRVAYGQEQILFQYKNLILLQVTHNDSVEYRKLLEGILGDTVSPQ